MASIALLLIESRWPLPPTSMVVAVRLYLGYCSRASVPKLVTFRLFMDPCSGDQDIPRKNKKKNLESLVNKAKKRKFAAFSEESKDDKLNSENENVTPPSFTIIGRQVQPKSQKVKQFLPNWLANPISITTDLKNLNCPIENVEYLDKALVEKLKSDSISFFFPVQEAVIPWMLNDIKRFGLNLTYSHRPRDLCVSAPTGSGKTLAYVLPIVQCLSKRVVPKIRALIVAPVQELVLQITSVFKLYCAGTNLQVLSAVGGRTPLHLEQEKLVQSMNCALGEFESLVDILVTTPGRLVEHLENTKGFDLSYLRYLVMDEADRMLDNIQNDWLHHLEKHFTSRAQLSSNHMSLKKNITPQRLLFSATLSQDPEKLKKLNLFQPVLFSTVSKNHSDLSSDRTEDYIGSFTTPAELKERFIIVDPILKPVVICQLISKGWRRILCFTKSALGAHKLSKLISILNPDIKITEISSLLQTDQREKILSDFSSGSVDMLVCSDIMARGIDINNVKYVISYDPPKHIKSYIHRVGRTGRGGTKGTAVTIVSSNQAPAFSQMLSDVNKNDVKQMAVDEEQLNNLKPDYKNALQELKHLLKVEQDRNVKLEKANNTVLRKKRLKKRLLKKSKIKK